VQNTLAALNGSFDAPSRTLTMMSTDAGSIVTFDVQIPSPEMGVHAVYFGSSATQDQVSPDFS